MGGQDSRALVRNLWDSGWPLYLSSRRASHLHGEAELTCVVHGGLASPLDRGPRHPRLGSSSLSQQQGPLGLGTWVTQDKQQNSRRL